MLQIYIIHKLKKKNGLLIKLVGRNSKMMTCITIFIALFFHIVLNFFFFSLILTTVKYDNLG